MRISSRLAVAATAVATLLLTLHVPAGALDTQPLPLNACLSKKIGCVIKKKACLLGCQGKGAAAGTAADQACIDKCRNGFDPAFPKVSCFEKLEAKGGCITTGDDEAIECKIDAFVLDAVEELRPNAPANKCTKGKLSCLKKYNSCILSKYKAAAAKGLAIDPAGVTKCNTILDGGAKGVAAGCFGKLEAKGGCDTTGDYVALQAKDNAFIDDLMCELQASGGPNNMQTLRCTGDTRVQCPGPQGSPIGCAVPGGTCEFYFGSNLALSAGGVSTCAVNQWNGVISGIANPDNGVSFGTASLIAKVYTGITTDQPCPQCNGDRWPNDGANGGTCLGGLHNGLACDGNGTSPNPSFGTTSMDCPPSPGALIGTLPISLNSTNNGAATLATSPASPLCHAGGFPPGTRCPCDVCSILQTKPCQTNADCLLGEGTCGGAVVGAPTAPNPCNPPDGAPDGCQPTANGEAECADGPIDNNCVIETQKGCLTNADCPAPGDACQPKLRECFLDPIVAQGTHNTPVNGWSRPTFASVFCVPPTGSAAVNNVAGLPGPGRLQLTGVAHDNGASLVCQNDSGANSQLPCISNADCAGGTCGLCPTTFDFTGTSRGGVLDTGWTGIAHDASAISGGMVSVSSVCPGLGTLASPCGNCTYTGPIPNP